MDCTATICENIRRGLKFLREACRSLDAPPRPDMMILFSLCIRKYDEQQ